MFESGQINEFISHQKKWFRLPESYGLHSVKLTARITYQNESQQQQRQQRQQQQQHVWRRGCRRPGGISGRRISSSLYIRLFLRIISFPTPQMITNGHIPVSLLTNKVRDHRYYGGKSCRLVTFLLHNTYLDDLLLTSTKQRSRYSFFASTQ